MNAPHLFLLAKLARERETLRESVADLDRAVSECEDAKRESLEILAEIEAILRVARVTVDRN